MENMVKKFAALAGAVNQEAELIPVNVVSKIMMMNLKKKDALRIV